jgi:methylmalonyl-CoA mutase N-terminal domain/subunit
MGGMVAAIERGYPQKEIAESAYRFQQAVEQRDRIIVGVNAFVEEQQEAVGILYIDESVAHRQLARLEHVKATRDNDRVRSSLARLQAGTQAGENTMPLLLDAVRAYATIGEMCDALREVWGEYEETPVI